MKATNKEMFSFTSFSIMLCIVCFVCMVLTYFSIMVCTLPIMACNMLNYFSIMGFMVHRIHGVHLLINHRVHFLVLDHGAHLVLGMQLREAILQKIPFFYEILSQTGGGVGLPDFISLIQKLLSLSNHPFFKDPLISG